MLATKAILEARFIKSGYDVGRGSEKEFFVLYTPSADEKQNLFFRCTHDNNINKFEINPIFKSLFEDFIEEIKSNKTMMEILDYSYASQDGLERTFYFGKNTLRIPYSASLIFTLESFWREIFNVLEENIMEDATISEVDLKVKSPASSPS